MAEINIKDAFRELFGYEAPQSFSLQPSTGRKEQSNLGQPYYETDMLGREFFLPVKINGVLIPFAVMSMNWKKTIQKTAMPERGGSVHELISVDDYTFNIKGILADESGEFPEQGIMEIFDLFSINSSLEMRSALSDIVLSGEAGHRVIIKEVKWPAAAAVENLKGFEISCESDQILDLEIIE